MFKREGSEIITAGHRAVPKRNKDRQTRRTRRQNVYRENAFHPHDTATGGLLDFRRVAAPVS